MYGTLTYRQGWSKDGVNGAAYMAVPLVVFGYMGMDVHRSRGHSTKSRVAPVQAVSGPSQDGPQDGPQTVQKKQSFELQSFVKRGT